MLKSNVLVCVSFLAISTAALADGPNDVPSWFFDSHSTVTREQVKAELAQAQARGELMQGDGGGYPTASASTGLSRKQVQAELREAQRLGLTNNSDAGSVFGTPEQEAMIAKAGAAAAEKPVVAKGE